MASKEDCSKTKGSFDVFRKKKKERIHRENYNKKHYESAPAFFEKSSASLSETSGELSDIKTFTQKKSFVKINNSTAISATENSLSAGMASAENITYNRSYQPKNPSIPNIVSPHFMAISEQGSSGFQPDSELRNFRNDENSPFKLSNQVHSPQLLNTTKFDVSVKNKHFGRPSKFKKVYADNFQSFKQEKNHEMFSNKMDKSKKYTFMNKKDVHEDKNMTPLFLFQSKKKDPAVSLEWVFPDSENNISDSDSDSFIATSSLGSNLSLNDSSDVSDLSFSIGNAPIQSFNDAEANSFLTKESDNEKDPTSKFSTNSKTYEITNELYYTNKEAFISVFWDLESCSLPAEKSVVDFARCIRNKFYYSHIEVAFAAIGNISKLSAATVNEFNEASVTLIHTTSYTLNKKILNLLERFQSQNHKSNSTLVLISNDSNFSQALEDIQHQHIFVKLICSSNAPASLITAGNECVFLEKILDELPNREVEDSIKHILTITNLPKMKLRQIKSCLSERLKAFDFKMKLKKGFILKVTFKNECDCMKAMTSLKGLYLGENELHIEYRKELVEVETKSDNNKKEDKESVNVKRDVKADKNNEATCVKGVSMCIFIGEHAHNIGYWKNKFENEWKMNDFEIAQHKTFEKYFLINFKSLKKAQKVKKILLKNQSKDPSLPKFINLFKEQADFGDVNATLTHDLEEYNKKKINKYLHIIEKQNLIFLKKHEKIIADLKSESVSGTSETIQAINAKLKECLEQLTTFQSYYNMIKITFQRLNYHTEDFEQNAKELVYDFNQECNCFSSALPIYAKKEEILEKIREQKVLIVRAETGSGKSTQLTMYVWRDRNRFQNGIIICTQPRKIAAISLAKHVSSLIGCRLGDIVGYQVGMSKKMSSNTRILYVTDFTMLKNLINGNLDLVSCIIIDEAHERSIYTDILLGMIKKYLPNYPHLKVIITSATIDTTIFRDYFSLTDNAVLNISGRTFPIEDVWLQSDVTPVGDYFLQTVEKTFEILNEGPGHVLSFLTNPLETEKASEIFSEKLKNSRYEKVVKVYFLHGKMNPDEQQKVFANTSELIRKVIFATNCAETSITIPGIKFVIDCGLVKESKYDSIRNMNVLCVNFVSKSSAEQRRGRAGRTQSGKCYRLYSKNNYKCMVESSVPEILRVNLGQALLKLLKLGIENPLQFDFIQSPPKELLIAAINQLLYLGAVNERYSLTDLGKKMATLPLEPRLCHLIFLGIDNDVGYDALAVAALVTMSHAIFFRNAENKDEADRKKGRFCEFESDFISFLTVFKEWASIPKNFKSQWCVINCINARSMRTVHELVNEIILILKTELQYDVKQKFCSEAPYDTLTRIIFCSFSQNLSVFSGHTKYGYRNLNTADQFMIHPSSSLMAFGFSTPEFVIFETILKTTRTYIFNVCPIKREMIICAMSEHNVKVNLEALEKLVGSEYCICPVGERILFSYFIGKKGSKRKELLRKAQEILNSDSIEIDIDVSKGCIKIFGFDLDLDKTKALIHPILHDAQQHLLNEEKDVCIHERGPLIAVLTAGGSIADIILPDEFRDVKVILKGQENIESIIEKLSRCGSIKDVRNWEKYVKVSFKTPAAARMALEAYSNETEFVVKKIHKYPAINERRYLYKIFMRFSRRPCLGVAFISTEPRVGLYFKSALSLLPERIETQLSVSKKSGDIRVVGLPANIDKKRLEDLVSSALPFDTKITKCVVSRKKPYESTTEELDLIEKNITDLFMEFTFKEQITVLLKKPRPMDFYWDATIYFKNAFDGENAVNVLRNRKHLENFVGGFELKPVLQTFLCCKSQIFPLVKDEVEQALEFYKKDQPVGTDLQIKVIPKGTEIVEIQIMSNSVSVITDIRRCIHDIVNGDELKLIDSSSKAKLFSSSGKEYVRKLSSEFEDCYIIQNDYTKIVSLIGKESSRNLIKLRLNTFLSELENDAFKELNLRTDSGKPGVLKELLKTYGYDLEKLKEDCGISEIIINKYKQLLTIQGQPSAISKCESIIQNIKEKLDSDFSEANGELCPVCYGEVSENKHRLQYCGHAYCTECLLHLFQNSEAIPLRCEEQACQALIVLSDIFWAINTKEPLQTVLFKKCFSSYVENNENVNYCFSPDCTMVYRVTKDKMNIFRCPGCGNSICTKCGDVYHNGISCELNKSLMSGGGSLEVWRMTDPLNNKYCPSCSSPIEKNDGCNHMTCWKCKSHFCWPCLRIFPDGDAVYNHQPYCPVNPQ